MGYKVKVYTNGGAHWLAYGKLTTERKATYFLSPGKAREAAEKYVELHSEFLTWEVVQATNGRLRCGAGAPDGQLKITFNIDALNGGQFRVWSREASIDVVTTNLPNMLSNVAKDWAEQVVDDLGGSEPADVFKLDMDKEAV